MNGRITRGLLVWAGLSLACGSVAVAGGIELKPVFKNGTTHYLELSEENTQTLKAEMLGPDPIVMVSTSLYGVAEEYQADGDGGKIKMTIERRKMTFNHPMMGDMSHDTDSGDEPSDDNSMSLIASPYVGKTLVVHLDKDGKVTKLEGFDDLSEAIEDSAMGDMFYEQARDSISADALQNELIDWRYDLLPGTTVEVGETWTRAVKDENPFLGKVVTTYDCKLEKVEGKQAHISFSSKTTMQEGETPPANAAGMKPELKSLGANGTAVYDSETGLIVQGKMTSSGQFEMSMPDMEGQGLSVTIAGKTSARSLTPKARAAEKAAAAKAAPAEVAP